MTLPRMFRSSALPAIALFLAFTTVNSILSPSFMSIRAWTGFLQSTIPIVLLSMGEAIVIIGGGIDISVGATVCLVNTMMATLSSTNGPVALPVALCMGAALAIGLLNGFLVAVLRIPPLLATFATSFIGSGLALSILPTPGGTVPGVMSDFYYYVIFNVLPMPLLFAAAIGLVWWALKRSHLGPFLYATGHHSGKAYFSGVNVTLVSFIPYALAGLVAGLAGIAVSCNFGAGDPRVGANMTLNSVAACVIGGVSLAGGSGTVTGSVFGAFFLYEVLVTVLGLDVPVYFQDLVTGLTVVLGITLAVVVQRRNKRQTEAY